MALGCWVAFAPLQKPFAPTESNRHLVTDKKLAMQTTQYLGDGTKFFTSGTLRKFATACPNCQKICG